MSSASPENYTYSNWSDTPRLHNYMRSSSRPIASSSSWSTPKMESSSIISWTAECKPLPIQQKLKRSTLLLCTDHLGIGVHAPPLHYAPRYQTREHAARCAEQVEDRGLRPIQHVQTGREISHCLWLTLLRLSWNDQRITLRSRTNRFVVLGHCAFHHDHGQTTLRGRQHLRPLQQNQERTIHHR